MPSCATMTLEIFGSRLSTVVPLPACCRRMLITPVLPLPIFTIPSVRSTAPMCIASTPTAARRFHLWRQRFPNGRIEQVTSGPTEEEGIAIDPDGKSFVTSVGLRRRRVWLHDQNGERMLTSEATAA